MSTHLIAKNTISQIGGKIISTALGLAAVALMTRSLGLEQFGWYVTAVGFLQFIGILSDFGFILTTTSLLSEPAFDKEKLFNTLFSWRFVTALVFLGVAPFIFLLFPYPAPVKVGVAITSVSFFALAIGQVFIGYYQSKLQNYQQAISEVLGRVALVGGVLLATITHTGFIATMGAVTVASLISTLYLIKKHGPVQWCFDREISRAIFQRMWPTALSVICNGFYLQGDRVLLPLYASQTTVGLYGAAYRVLDIIIQIAALIMGVMIPLASFTWSRQQWDAFKTYFQLSLTLVAAVLFPAIAGIFVLDEPIMRFVAGAEFAEAGHLLRYLSLSIIGICFSLTFGYLALAINQQRQALWIYFSDAILSTIGYIVCIRAWGVWGAVGVTIFSEWYAGLGLAYIVIKTTKNAPPFLTLGKIAFASLIMAGALKLAGALPLFLSLLLGVVSYSFFIIAFKVVSLAHLRTLLVAKKAQFDTIPSNPA